MHDENRPNIILITTDQQRFDSLAINGSHNVKTPNIDKAALEGVNFSNAFVQNTVCVPSRACIQTGRYTHQHGVTYMEPAVDETPGLPDTEKTFMEYLQDNGYFTGATGKIHMYPEKGFHRHNLTGGKGQRWLYPEGSPLGPAPLGRNYAEWLEKKRPGAYEEIYRERRGQASYNKIGVMDIPLNEDEYVENWISEQSVNFINKGAKSEKPFFLWCGFCGPHGPFDPPEPYRGMYNPEDVELPPETEGFPSWRDICDEKLMRQCIAYYQAMVTCIDFHVGKIINELKRLGIYDNTMIIYVSDHGEMLGEKGLMGKCVFYEPVTRVPMWIRPPAGSVFKKGNFDGLTEAMDIAPTILDYAGIEIPGKMTAKSLRPVIQDRANTGHNMIFSEYVDNNKNEMSKCVRTSEYKYIRFFKSGKEELYNITRDPLEQNNLVEVQKEKKEELKDMMFSRIALTETIRNYG